MSPSYAYYASASALGGVIRQGNQTTVIPTIGSVCLASAGGQASNSVDYYDRDGISFTRAETRVGGYSTGGSDSKVYTTVSEVLLLNLRIFKRLSVARMQAIVTSKRELNSTTDPRIELEPDRTVFSIMVNYHGVEIDGAEVGPVVDQQLCDASTYANFTRLLMDRRESLPTAVQDVLYANDAMPAPKPTPPLSGPLVTFPGNPNAQANRVHLNAFGSASFGDLLVKPDRQRVSLMRLSLLANWNPLRPEGDEGNGGGLQLLDDPVGGEGGGASAGDGGTNGAPTFP